jgi:hypothetical protein
MINSEKVIKLFENCLFKEEEIINGKPIVDPICAEGVMSKIGFHPERIKEATNEIVEMLNCLPEEFKSGYTFLNFCQTKDGKQWTGLHQVCDQLVTMGIAIGKITYCLPREMWSILPGGVPYIQIN